MRILYILTILILASTINAQVDFDYNSVTDESVIKRNSFKREKWFYERRINSLGFIPVDAYAKAIQERDALRMSQGFFTNTRNTWINIGPSPGAYQLNGATSSRITTVKYHPTNPNIIYLGAAYGGVWKSTDGGTTFVPKTDNEISMASGSICIDPVNPEIIYYGTGEATYSGASYTGRGILKSTNGGDAWTSGLQINSYCSRLVIRPGHSNELLNAAGTQGLYRSTDAGVTWVQMISSRVDDVVFTPSGDTVFILGNSTTGWRVSTNGGVSFGTAQTPFTLGTRSHFGICKASPNIIYAATYTGTEVLTYKSTNSGVNFTQVGASFGFTGQQAWYDFYVHVSPFDPNLAMVGTFNLQRTTDGGNSWQYVTYNQVHVDQHNMDYNPVNSNEFIVSNDGGIWKTTNRGNNWTNMNNSLTLTQFYRIATSYTDVNHVMGGTQDNGTQRTTGTPAWSSAYGGDGGVVCFHPRNLNTILGETQNNGVFRSTNGGASFTGASNGLSGSGAWVAPIIAHPDSSQIFYTARQKIFKTTNGAASWDSIASTPTNQTVNQLAISKSNPSIMYCAAPRLFKSTNRGYTWFSIGASLPGNTCEGLEVHPDSPNVVIIGLSALANKIFKTTDGGTTWSNLNGNLPQSYANDVMIYHPGFPTNTILAALDVGVFMTNNGGTSWIELASGLPNTIPIDLDYHLGTNTIKIGTHGRGVWKLNGPLVGIVNSASSVPDNYSLYQNYPNPFNPVTKIKYSVKQSGIVKLKVYDALGRNVSVIVNQNQSPGTYEVVFDAANLTSGIYFYQLEAGNYSETKKMMVLK
jgi:photosystem II stability/assembly factor-like uncharacterized protein